MEKRIIEIMREVLGENDINVNSTQSSIKAWNSMNQLILASEIEEAFDIELDPEEIAEMNSVYHIMRIVKHKTT